MVSIQYLSFQRNLCACKLESPIGSPPHLSFWPRAGSSQQSAVSSQSPCLSLCLFISSLTLMRSSPTPIFHTPPLCGFHNIKTCIKAVSSS